MSELQIGPLENGRVPISGAMTFDTVVAGLAQIRQIMVAGDPMVVDLQHLQHADSAALAMLLQLVDEAAQAKVSLSFANMPDFLLGIARLSNAEDILPLTV